MSDPTESEPNSAQQAEAVDGSALMRMATYAATATALILAVTKVVAWLWTDSVALLSSTVDSLLDGAASLVNLLAVRHALQPADEQHRFGHGKAEPLAGLAQSAFVAGSGVLLIIHAASRFYTPVPVRDEVIGIGVMVFSIILTLALVSYQKYVVRHTNSVAISADSLHYTGDLLINGSVIISLLISMFLPMPWVDPLFAIGIALFLLYNAWGIACESMDLLMDKEFDEEDREKILAIAHANDQVYDAHDLRTRSSGQQQFIQLHLEMDRNFSLAKAHAIADRVEREIREAFPSADVIIHQDPWDIREPGHDELAYEDRKNGTPNKRHSGPSPIPPEQQDEKDSLGGEAASKT